MREAKSIGIRAKTRNSDEVRKKCFFIFEGVKTEPLYFDALKKQQNTIGISSLTDLIKLERLRGEENWSNPLKLLNQLDLDLSGKITYNKLLDAAIDTLYISDYLKKHENYIQEFSKLLRTFMNENLHIKGTDIVSNVKGTTQIILDYFKESWPKVCSIILENIDNALDEQSITFDKSIDTMCLVVDRDLKSFVNTQFDEVMEICNKRGYKFLITNPCFEFWLLLHFDKVNEFDRKKMLENKNVNESKNNSVSFLEDSLKNLMGTYKKKNYDADSLVLKIQTAIKNEKNFCETLPELKTELGSNIGVFMKELING